MARIDLRRKPRHLEALAEGLIKTTALVSVLAVLLILVFVGKEALPLLTNELVRSEVTPLQMLGKYATTQGNAYMWQPVGDVPKYSVLPLFLGSLKVTLVAICYAVPLSIGAAVYVAEFAPKRLREWVKPAIEMLSGVPSVVVGFFALVVLADWVHRIFGTDHRLNAGVAGLGLAFAVCPVVFSVSEDALRAVPSAYRAAALALGSTRSQTILRVVLPAAAPGIGAAVVLGFGRAIGETMIVLLASGNAALSDASFGHSVRTFTATIAQELGEVVVGSAHYHVLFALGALLFLSTFGINMLGERALHRSRQRLEGKRG